MYDIKELRMKKNMTQDELANEIGVTRQNVSLYEAGKVKPSVEVAKELGRIFEVPWSGFYE